MVFFPQCLRQSRSFLAEKDCHIPAHVHLVVSMGRLCGGKVNIIIAVFLEKLIKVLKIMLTVWCANKMKEQAETMIAQL